ncbi:MAG TPA: hypothetical protein VGG84_05430 [Gemmatimonadaceae bacterium]
MRKGDFGLDIVPAGDGRVRELDSGHVLARPGQVYRLRLRNFGPLPCVADVTIDGERVTAGGLVLEPWSATELEHPIGTHDDGCFTVVAEGDETVFGDDGGRDNRQLGLVEARFRRELPRRDRKTEIPAGIMSPSLPAPPRPLPGIPPLPSPLPSRFPPAPPEWVPPLNRRAPTRGFAAMSVFYPGVLPAPPAFYDDTDDAIERAAGTGLTGHSDQQFIPVSLGPLEAEATVIQLRLVIGSDQALAADAPRPLIADEPPSRPAARP